MHPFQIALFLPRQTTTPLLHLLYRSLWSADIPHSTTYWLQLRLAALIALSITVSSESDAGPSSKHTPAQLWDSARRTLGSKEITGEYHDRHRASAEAIGALVEWTEEMLTMRKEDMAKWFEGKEWLGLLEMWIGFGRRVSPSLALRDFPTRTGLIATARRRSDHRQSPLPHDYFHIDD